MITRQRIVSYGIPTVAAGTIVAAALLTMAHNSDVPPEIDTPPNIVEDQGQPAGTQQIDVVFAIDTTASMGGLIEGAKRTVWSIASHIKSNQKVDVHVGLVAYRDIGDDYTTRDFALTGDLDAMFAELSGYRAAGGGDIPEDVAAGLNDAIYKMQWRKGATKMIFVVGDAPPIARGDVPTYDVLAKAAADEHIIVNTIRCGFDAETATTWKQIADLGHGEFSTIQQDGGVQSIATPYDDKLAALSTRIDSNTVILGAARRHAYNAKMEVAAAAPAATKADRAGYFAKGGAGRGAPADDAVARVATGGEGAADGIVQGDLPTDLQVMSKDDLKKELARRADERKAAEKEIGELSKKREEFLKEHAAKDGFDAKVKATVDRELARH